MKQKRNEGFSYLDALIAITVLALAVVPILSGLETSLRLNKRTDDLLQAQLAVSSALEQLMAEGITDESIAYDFVFDLDTESFVDRFPEVEVKTTAIVDSIEDDGTVNIFYYDVKVTDNDDLVSVTTTIRAAKEEGDR
ncbi:MAG: type II secretion system protein [Oscillospiraceae bacterium]|nr:type II secretion system protein [Oscillospiraceae bacterium]